MVAIYFVVRLIDKKGSSSFSNTTKFHNIFTINEGVSIL